MHTHTHTHTHTHRYAVKAKPEHINGLMNLGLNQLAMHEWEKAFYTFDTAVGSCSKQCSQVRVGEGLIYITLQKAFHTYTSGRRPSIHSTPRWADYYSSVVSSVVKFMCE